MRPNYWLVGENGTMPKFVCPECQMEISGDEENQLIGEAVKHMEAQHEKENFSAQYAKGNIRAQSQ